MSKINTIATAIGCIGLAACGGGNEKAENDINLGSQVIEADTADDAVDIYVAHLVRIADAIETIESNEDAEAAATTIASRSAEFETLAERFDGASKVKVAAAFASRADELTAPQMRIATTMQRLAAEHPEYLERISEALDEMPPVKP